ncbi:MAG: 47 kDa outer membrane protein precursor [Syntrophus sp. PtaU1.Bin208]|nr:MAG: 47 kDa outer membrane protein precursor [Syntrophus sp. PtaU1.Bin208]
MNKKKSSPKTFLCVVTFVLFSLPSLCFGSGFGIFTQGASSLGQGAAVVAHDDSPEAIFFNPALINGLPGTQVEVGTTLIFADREFKSAATGKTAETEDDVFYPSTFYITHALNDSVSFGLGVFNPFGLATTWPDDWEGKYIATKSELTTFNINPVVSWRIIPEFTVAAGLDFVLLDSTLERKFSTGIPGVDGHTKFEGDGHGLGFNLGFLIKPTDTLSIGISYRSKVKIDVDGNVSMTIPAMSFHNRETGDTSLTLPQQVFAGIAYRANEKLTLEMGMRWEDWSSFDELKIKYDGQSEIVPRDWRSTFAFNLGGKYRINDRYAINAGYLYGQNPVPDSTFDPSIPDSDVHLFCIGGEARFGNFSTALSYAYQLQDDRTKSTNRYGAIANGEYDSDIHLLALSLRYKF